VQSDRAFSEPLSEEEVLQEGLDGLSCELEAGVLRVGQDVVEQACKGNDQFTNKATNNEDAILLGIGVTNVVDLRVGRVEVF
jgi:hypothetical protein